MEKRKLSNNVEIPVIGYGTYKAAAEDKSVITKALKSGYYHLDTAAFYGNEDIVGESVRLSKIPREELFLTSKVWKEHMSYKLARASFEDSLKRIGTDYLDLYLIHWPKENLENDDWKQQNIDTWKVMEELYLAGQIKAIGVSNFLPHHLMNLCSHANIMPMVDQLEFHPGYIQKAAVDYCKKHDICVEAWSPFGRGRIFQEPLLLKLAEKYQKSVAQICIRFALQCEVIPLPKASTAERMEENKNVFDFVISESDMYQLMTLPQIGWSGEHPDRERVVI